MTVNLFSDTQTRPTEAMRHAMAQAEVGDEQRFDDPTVNALQERVAELLGKEAALFLPSGTMCNAIAFRLHVRPGGDEVILDRTSHPVQYEAGGPAALSGAMLNVLDGDGGIFTAAQVEAAVRPAGDRYGPRSRLVSVEQTTNIGGGRVWPLEALRAVLDVASRHGLRSHLDGARLMNAVVASGVPAADYAARLRHGLDRLHEGPRRAGRRRAGRVARADRRGLALQADDGRRDAPGGRAGGRRRCTRSTTTSSASPRTTPTRAASPRAWPRSTASRIDPDRVETNIVDLRGAGRVRVVRPLWERGVQLAPLDPQRLRAVTHLDVDAAGIERALDGVSSGAGGLRRLKRAPHELRGDEQHEAGEADLQRALRDVVREHRADHHAGRRTAPRSRARPASRTLP